jgi:hypothetical protein
VLSQHVGEAFLVPDNIFFIEVFCHDLPPLHKDCRKHKSHMIFVIVVEFYRLILALSSGFYSFFEISEDMN